MLAPCPFGCHVFLALAYVQRAVLRTARAITRCCQGLVAFLSHLQAEQQQQLLQVREEEEAHAQMQAS